MNIYFEWTQNYSSHNNNISIFDLEISQKENCFANARLVIDALTPLPPIGVEGVIQGENKEVFFKGRLVGSPLKIEGDFAEIELIARPPNFQEKLIVLQKETRVSPYWDELWVNAEKLTDLQEIQDVRAASLYCDRRTGDLSLSDWFEGGKKLRVGEHFFSESLQIKWIKAPLKACTVKVHAHWIQSESGISNLSSHIRRIFPLFKVSTYTEKAILDKWPEQRKRLGRSGLWVVKSALKSVTPSSSLYPNYSPAVPLTEEGNQLKQYRVKRHWFKPILWIGWKVQQKRKETLSFTLTHDFQPIFPGEAEHKILEFTLQNINPDLDVYSWQAETFYRQGTKISYKNGIYKSKTPHTSGLFFEEDQEYWTFKKYFHTPLGDPARSSFFLTERGYLAAEHAMERAKVILAKSSRCIEVTFEGTWEDLKEVTTDTSITLTDPRLPGGEVTGKVVKYSLIAKGETGERFVRVTLLCAIGSKNIEVKNDQAIPTYAVDEYCDDVYQVYENKMCQTPSGLRYFRYDDQIPIDTIKRSPLLRGIELINGPQEQEAEIRKHAFSSPAILQKVLSDKPTRLRLYFKDLRTKDRADHFIAVKMAAPWSASRQVCAKNE